MIVYTQLFSGMIPGDSPRLIPDSNAQEALWARLDNTELRPWGAPVRVIASCPRASVAAAAGSATATAYSSAAVGSSAGSSTAAGVSA